VVSVARAGAGDPDHDLPGATQKAIGVIAALVRDIAPVCLGSNVFVVPVAIRTVVPRRFTRRINRPRSRQFHLSDATPT